MSTLTSQSTSTSAANDRVHANTPAAVESLRRALSYLKRANSAGSAGPLDSALLSYPYAVGAAEESIKSALALLGVRS